MKKRNIEEKKGVKKKGVSKKNSKLERPFFTNSEKDFFNKIKNVFGERISFILECKKFIFFAVALFFLFFLLGFLVNPSDFFLKKISELLSELFSKTEGLGFLGMFWFIFSNNVQASFFLVFFGIFFGILSIFILSFNGYFSGFVSLQAVKSNGISSLLSLVPHGIFELPAIFISAGLGIKLGFFLFDGSEKRGFFDLILSVALSFIFIVVPLLFLAGIIEAGLIIFLK